MEAKAIARTIRIAPRKVRLVIDLIRGKKVGDAFAILKNTDKRSTIVIEKVLKSAIANAEHNFNMNTENLYIKEAYVNEGPTLKRMRPRGKGRAALIKKRTSHITIVVAENQ